MSPFKSSVIEIVRAVPLGQVVSYGQVALYAGLPRAAREVGWILNGTEGKIDRPWWRVVNRNGILTIKGTVFSTRERQKKLLQAEGIEVSDEFRVSMAKYRFIASEEFLKKFQLKDDYIQMIIKKYHL